MSTYWYFECLDHTPPLQSSEEFTQHTRDRHWDRAMEMAAARPVERGDDYWRLGPHASDAERSDAYFTMQTRAFLSEHPSCRLGLVNEYGDHEPLPTAADGDQS